MSERLVSLTERRLEAVPEVVALVEDLLERARRGEVRGIAIAAACDRRCDATGFELGDGSIASLVLALERLKLRLLEVE